MTDTATPLTSPPPTTPAPTAPPRVALAFAIAVGMATVLSGPLILINPWFIGVVQERHDVADKMRLTQEEVDRINGEILWDIFIGGGFEVVFDDGKPVLGPNERAHMGDVSWLVRALVAVDLIALWLAAWGGRRLWRAPELVGRRLVIASGAVGVSTVLIGLFVVLAWDAAFTLFHVIFFWGGNWSFPPGSDMIHLYPPDFWFEAFLVAGGLILGTSVLLSYAGVRRIAEAEARRRRLRT